MNIEGSNYGHGFAGFKARIEAIAQALGGGKNVRTAVAEEFKQALMRQQKTNALHWPDWTEAEERHFDYAGWAIEQNWQKPPTGEVIATAPFNGVTLELRERNVYLHGGDFWMIVAMVGAGRETYSYTTRETKEKWSVFLTDPGCCAAFGSRYGSGDAKSTHAMSPTAATTSLRKLVEKHLKVTFTNVAAQAA